MSDELTILTAEHAGLQAARAACLQDMQGRATLFLTAVSGTLVALGFLGSVNRFGPFFVTFAVTLLYFVWALGTLTFLRIAQISIEETIIAFGLSRIRHRYVESIPALKDVFVRSIHDDLVGIRAEVGATSHWWGALMPRLFFAGAVLAGIAVCMLNLFALTRVSMLAWTRAVDRYPAKFPSA